MKLLSLFLTPLIALGLMAADAPAAKNPTHKRPKDLPGVQYLTVTLRVPANMANYTQMKKIVQMIDDIPYAGVFVVGVDVNDFLYRSAVRPPYLPKVDWDGNPVAPAESK